MTEDLGGLLVVIALDTRLLPQLNVEVVTVVKFWLKIRHVRARPPLFEYETVVARPLSVTTKHTAPMDANRRIRVEQSG